MMTDFEKNVIRVCDVGLDAMLRDAEAEFETQLSVEIHQTT